MNQLKIESNKKIQFIVGGEQLETWLAEAIYNKFEGNVEIYNEYGPTETTVGCMIYKFNPEDGFSNVPIGIPIANSQCYVLDNHQNLQPVGVVGELCIGGDGLARGYLNNRELTKENFISNPFKLGERLYKTGDLARWLPDGNIEFLGRIDNQVKIRGFRIELGEIESQLTAQDKIKEAVVLAKGEESNKQLVAYYVSEEELEVSELRTTLSRTLPDYMIPSYYVHMDTMPLTSNGKVDRKALPDPEITAGGDYVAPSNKTEEKLVEIWSDVLQLDKEIISVNRSFFELGGHSLLAIKICSLINKNFEIDFKITDLFKHPTINEEAVLISFLINAKFESTEFIENENELII
jgi:acyl-coenzyme A synthetase/AMP-(fatty) acid ligase/acyl carrier protein